MNTFDKNAFILLIRLYLIYRIIIHVMVSLYQITYIPDYMNLIIIQLTFISLV